MRGVLAADVDEVCLAVVDAPEGPISGVPISSFGVTSGLCQPFDVPLLAFFER